MAAISLRNAPRDGDGRLVGQGDDQLTSVSRIDKVIFPRQQPIEERIYDVVLYADRALTRREIARELGLKPSPWLIAHIDQLAADGYIFRRHGLWKNGCIVYLYYLREEHER